MFPRWQYFHSDFWEFSPTGDGQTPSGVWRQIPRGSNGLAPPPMIRMMSAYDSIEDVFYVWHGQYEDFNMAQSPSGTMWQYVLYVPVSQALLLTGGSRGIVSYDL